MLGIWFYPVNTCGNNWINGAFDDEESWEHVSFVNALLFPFLFWLFSPWLEELYNVFPLSFSVAGRAGKTWWGPRKTVNGRDFQWSSWSADKCLTWEENGGAASWGQEPAFSSEEISIDGGRSNSLDWNSVPPFLSPSLCTSPAHIAFHPYLVPLFCLCFLNEPFGEFFLTLFGPLFLLLARRIPEKLGVWLRKHDLITNLMLFWSSIKLFIFIFKFNYKF